MSGMEKTSVKRVVIELPIYLLLSLIWINFFQSRNHVLFIIKSPRPKIGFNLLYSLNVCA